MPRISFRRCLMVAFTTAVVGGWVAGGTPGLPAADPPAAKAKSGELTVETLGNLLSAIGVDAKKTESRYDFAFATKVGESDKEAEEWQLSMSVVLSDDQQSIWIMAWLNELPKSAQEVPRTALLKLLADNDKMGNGQFFAYISSNRRFVLQRVVPNKNITTVGFRDILVEHGHTVTEYHADWAVANWKNAGATNSATQAAGTPAAAGGDTAAKTAAPTGNDKGVIPAGTKTATKEAPKSKPAAVKK